MRSRQEAAIRNLEKALERCAKNGIVLMGMDDSLLAFDREALRKAQGGSLAHGDQYAAMYSLMDTDMEAPVEDKGAYLDSGGW